MVYNGTDCVVFVSSTEIVENIEYVQSNITEEIIVQEIIKKDAEAPKIIYVEEEKPSFRSGVR